MSNKVFREEGILACKSNSKHNLFFASIIAERYISITLKVILLFTAFIVSSISGRCQLQTISTKDSLRSFTYKLINKALTKRRFKKIAIWDFTDPQKRQSNAGLYISDQVSIYATDIDSVIVLDRQNMESIIKEHKLKDKDFLIDQQALLQLGKFSGADVLIVGKVGVFELEGTMQIYLKMVDANTAQTLSAYEAYIPIDAKFADLAGISLNSMERKLIEQDCKDKKIGIYCFFNNTAEEVRVLIYRIPEEDSPIPDAWGPKDELLVKPQESKCVYNILAEKSYPFIVFAQIENVKFQQLSREYDKGSINVERCKAKTYIIK